MDDLRKRLLVEDQKRFGVNTLVRRASTQMPLKQYVAEIQRGCFISEKEPYLEVYEGLYREIIPIVRHLPHGVRQLLDKDQFTFTLNQQFQRVMEECAKPRTPDESVWIGPALQGKLNQLNNIGMAHSIEIYVKDSLVGGVLGIKPGGLFVSLSVYSRVSGAGNAGFVVLQSILCQRHMTLHDAISPSAISRYFGGKLIPIRQFLPLQAEALRQQIDFPTITEKQSVAAFARHSL